MSDLNLTELRRLAEGVQRARTLYKELAARSHEAERSLSDREYDELVRARIGAAAEIQLAERSYFEAAGPATVLALIDEVERLRAERAEIGALLDEAATPIVSAEGAEWSLTERVASLARAATALARVAVDGSR
jgi:hypothetical protein